MILANVLSALVLTTSGEPAAVETATPAAITAPTPHPGLGQPVLFRGECTQGGGPAACRIVAVGIATDKGLLPLPCSDKAEISATRAKIAARYFAPGTELELYLRGAPAGEFTVEDEDAPAAGGCNCRATGRRSGAPGHTYTFIALLSDDPVQLAAARFPSGTQPDAQPIAVAALSGNPSGGAGPEQISVRETRRLREADQSVLVIDANAAGNRTILVAEGEGRDPEGWKIVWSSRTSGPDGPLGPLILVDAFDLGADGKADILLERVHRGEASEWVLLKRTEDGWK